MEFHLPEQCCFKCQSDCNHRPHCPIKPKCPWLLSDNPNLASLGARSSPELFMIHLGTPYTHIGAGMYRNETNGLILPDPRK